MKRISTSYHAPGPIPYVPLQHLQRLEAAYDPAQGLLELPAYAMGYFTRYCGGEPVHPTRESMEYVTLLALDQRQDLRDVFERVLINVLELQDKNEASNAFGTWPWFAEESLEEMQGVDLNWAGFISGNILDILAFRRDWLDGDVGALAINALEAACASMLRRDVGPTYTNICAMNSAILSAAGELLGRRDLLDSGLHHLKELYQRSSGYLVFDEYNSSVYTPILIEELDRLLRLVSDKRCRRMADELKCWAWHGVALHFHSGLMEWGGAQARAYASDLGKRQVRFLEEKVGLVSAPIASQVCPPSARKRFFEKARKDRMICLKASSGRRLSLWKTERISLGSVDFEQCWVQCRPLILHFKTEDGRSGTFRLRVLLDGRDYAGATLVTQQDKGAILAGVRLSADHGIWHRYMDRPQDGTIRPVDLRIRFELLADNAEVELPGSAQPGQFVCGDVSILICPSGRWLDRSVTWEIGSAQGCPCAMDGEDWFPTRPQGRDAGFGVWMDAVADLSMDSEIEVTEWQHVSFVVGIKVSNTKLVEDVYNLPVLKYKTRRARWEHGEGRLYLNMEAPLTIPESAKRSWRDPFWTEHPLQAVRELPYRVRRRIPLIEKVFVDLRRILIQVRLFFSCLC